MDDFSLKGGMVIDEELSQDSDAFTTVSGGDIYFVSDSSDFGDMGSVLDHIDFVAGGIFFFLIFIWLEGKVARISRRFIGNE